MRAMHGSGPARWRGQRRRGGTAPQPRRDGAVGTAAQLLGCGKLLAQLCEGALCRLDGMTYGTVNGVAWGGSPRCMQRRRRRRRQRRRQAGAPAQHAAALPGPVPDRRIQENALQLSASCRGGMRREGIAARGFDRDPPRFASGSSDSRSGPGFAIGAQAPRPWRRRTALPSHRAACCLTQAQGQHSCVCVSCSQTKTCTCIKGLGPRRPHAKPNNPQCQLDRRLVITAPATQPAQQQALINSPHLAAKTCSLQFAATCPRPIGGPQSEGTHTEQSHHWRPPRRAPASAHPSRSPPSDTGNNGLSALAGIQRLPHFTEPSDCRFNSRS
jgi:hypothetical protein